MARPVHVLLLAAVLGLMCLASGPSLADRETAEFVAQRADKALAARTWAEAESLYRKALEEDPTLLRARFGLSEALLGAGQRPAGVTEMRQFVAEAGALTPCPPALTALLTKAKKRLADLDTLGTELDTKIEAHASALVAFAGRYREKDPDVALEALEQALRLKPGHAKAEEQHAALKSRAPAVIVPLFNGKDATGWTWMLPPMWQVRDGLLVAKAENKAYLARTETEVRGDFDVRMEARFVQDWGAGRMFVLCPAMKDEHDTSRFGVLKEELIWDEALSRDTIEAYGALPAAKMDPPLDLRAWNVFELRYRKADITALINGKEVFKKPRPAGRDGGFVGLLVRDCAVDFRRVEFVQR